MSRAHWQAFNEERTILWIKRYDDEINKLEETLKIRRGERARFQAQLDQFRAPISPINRLSEDILILVFSETIEEFPMAVGRLLFVCRAWYRLITNQPTLWSRIYSQPTGDSNNLRRLTNYVNSAVRYSANVPLDIHLDLGCIGLHEFWTHVTTVMTETNNYEIYGEDKPDWFMDVSAWVDTEPGASRFPLLVDYAHLLEKHLRSLTGKSGKVASRWRSLHIFLDPELFEEINSLPLTFLCHPSPLLERLVIKLASALTPLHLTTFLP